MQYDLGGIMSAIGGSGGGEGALGGFLNTIIDNSVGAGFKILGNQIDANQNQVLTNSQLNANEALQKYNEGIQYDLWQKTNYPAQVEQLQKAGLNPALLYAKGGPGGTTGSVGGSVGMGMNAVGLSAPAQQAQSERLQSADVALKNAQQQNIEAQTPQEGPLMKAQIDSINQGISNAKAQEILTDAQIQTQRLTNSITNETIDDQISTIRATSNKIQNETQQAVRNNWMDAQTMDDKLKTIHGIMIGQFIQNNLEQTEAIRNDATTKQLINQISQNWKTIGINQQNANTQESQMKIQQMIKDIPDSKGIILHGLMKLIPNIIL